MRTAAVIAMLLPLMVGCTAMGEDAPSPPAMTEGPCRNEGLDRFIGQTATADLGAELVKVSGARTLRWGAPGMAMTMDFRADRLTVSYDEKMAITSARCG